MIQPSATFTDNLLQLPPIDGVQRVDLVDGTGAVIASIENAPGKQGSLAVYRYQENVFGALDARAAGAGQRPGAHPPGAHPNVDRLLTIAAGGAPLHIEVITARG